MAEIADSGGGHGKGGWEGMGGAGGEDALGGAGGNRGHWIRFDGLGTRVGAGRRRRGRGRGG